MEFRLGHSKWRQKVKPRMSHLHVFNLGSSVNHSPRTANDTKSMRVRSVTDAKSAELLVIRLPGTDQTLKDLEFRLGVAQATPSA